MNSYRGKVTTNITAPLPSYQVKTIEEGFGKGFNALWWVRDSFKELDLFAQWKHDPNAIRELVLNRGNAFYNWFVNVYNLYSENAKKYNVTFNRLKNQTLLPQSYNNISQHSTDFRVTQTK